MIDSHDLVAPTSIRGIALTPLDVPLRIPLGTSAAMMRTAPLLLVDVHTADGLVGHAYLFCYRGSAMRAIAAILADIAGLVQGRPVDPRGVARHIDRPLALLGTVGIVRMATAALDMALWDIVAKGRNEPLWRTLGGSDRPIPAYNSCGLGLIGPAAVADEAERLLAGGFRALKVRAGYATLADDIAAFRAVRQRVGDDIALMVDYNQALGVDEALKRGQALEAEGAYWLEEPIRHDDWAGAARIAQTLNLPVQLGENFDGAKDLERAFTHLAFDYAMPDLARIGGVSEWLDCAAFAERHAIPLSSHLFAEVSAQVLAATPTAHWLEYMDWAAPILAEPLVIRDGAAQLSSAPGNGLGWNSDAVGRYRVA